MKGYDGTPWWCQSLWPWSGRLMHHSAVCVNTRCLLRSVRRCGALGLPERRAATVTWDFMVRLDLMQR